MRVGDASSGLSMRAYTRNARACVTASIEALSKGVSWWKPGRRIVALFESLSAKVFKENATRRFNALLEAFHLPAWVPVLAFAAVFWIASAVCLQFAQGMEARICVIFGVLSIAACLLFGVGVLTGKGNLLSLMLAGILLGAGVSSIGAYGFRCDEQAALEQDPGTWCVRVVEDSREGDFGSSCLGRVDLPQGGCVKVRLNLPEGTRAYCWQYVTGSGELKEPSARSFPSYWKKACVASLSLDNPVVSNPGGFLGLICLIRERGLGVLDDAFPSNDLWADASALVKAVLFGDRTELFASDLYDVMKTVGLAHIVAVSGAHLVMVTGFAVVILQVLGVPRRVCIPLQLGIVISYACLTALPVSVLRAAVMSFCALASFYAKRASASVNALAICVVGIISVNPFLALSISLVLSACASLGIMLLSQGISKFLSSATSGVAGFVTDSLSVCISANVFTLPFSISVFGQVPLIAPVSNLLAAPVFPFLVCYGLGSVIVSLAVPAISKLLLFPLMLVAGAFCVSARLMAKIPFACVAVDGETVALFALVLLMIAFFCIAKKLLTEKQLGACGLTLLVVLGMVFFAKPHLKGDEVIMCDVGQGDAIVLRSGNHAVLVDTGTNDSTLLKALARHGVRKLDAVLITHPDDDHCGSLRALFGAVPVGEVCVVEGVLDSKKESCRKLSESIGEHDCEELLAGDSFSVGAFQVEILSPELPTKEGANEDSLVLLATADVDGNGEGDWSFLLTGDAEAEVIEPLVGSKLEEVDVLKVPHHGSAGSVSSEMLNELQPRLALVSVGENNRYGHPTHEALSLLESAGARIVRTDEMGDVVCKLRQDGIRVECLK